MEYDWDESARSLCAGALDEMASGIESTKRTYPFPTLEEREGAIEAAETLLQIAVLIGSFLPDEGDEIIHQIQLIVSLMKEENDENVYDQEIQAVSRPALHIQKHQLTFLLENYFKITDIARLFGCSPRPL